MLNLAALYPVMNHGLQLGQSSSDQFFHACLLLLGISILAVSVKFIYSYLMNRLQIIVSADAQRQIFSKLVKTNYNF